MIKVNTTVTQKIGEEFKEWQIGENIILDMAMGRGKTFFIVNVLGEYAEQEGKKILYLCNRSELESEVFSDVKETWATNITVKTYQSMQKSIEKKEDIDVYDYIVCDECHYLFKDAWNDKTDIMYEWLESNHNMVKIFMSATGHNVFPCIKRWGDYKEYILNPDYSYIKRIVFYDNDQHTDRIIENLEDDEKVIYFSRKIENAYNVYKKYIDNASFICSKYTKHKEYKQYITSDALNNGILKNKITCTTSVWDNGINIKDSNLKHIICDMEDLVTLVQAIGRKRVGQITDEGFVLSKDDNITLYIRNWSKQNLTQFINPKRATLNEANKYLCRDEKWIAEQIESRNKRINECLYINYVYDTGTVEMNYARYIGLEKETKRLQYAIDHGFDKYVLAGLGESFVGEVEYISIEQEKQLTKIEMLARYLDGIVGDVMLTKYDRQEMIQRFNLIDGNHSSFKNGDIKYIQSMDTLNDYLVKNNMLYTIKQFETSRIVNNKKKKFKSAWKVMKLVDNIA